MSEPSLHYPTTLVIMGATGDLMARKITPALWHLLHDKRLPKQFKVVGFAKDDITTEQFREKIEANVRLYGPKRFNARDLKHFLNLFDYRIGRFENMADFTDLSTHLKSIHDEWGVCANTLFYLAVPPPFYETIFTHLANTDLTKLCSPEEGWTRILVEKPFGRDAATAQKLDELLGNLFKEIQIYRIDHYLAKDMLQNIIAFRFANNMFEHMWSAQFIEDIQIRLWEKIGVEKRGAFYDGVGALRDVGQNHLLQMLALITMDQPKDLSPEALRESRTALLKQLRVPTAEEVRRTSFRSQYDGYAQIEGVAADSQTETYAQFQLQIASDRWHDVPIILESGKRMGRALKEIVITFRHPTPCLCPPGGEHYKNKIVIRLEPTEHIAIHFWSKKPGLDYDYEERTLEFLYRAGKKPGHQYVEEYEKLFLDCIAGDQTLFVSTAEVAAMWRAIDPIVRGWDANDVPLNHYEPETVPVVELAPAVAARKEVAMIGLGKMGGNLAGRLTNQGWTVRGYDKVTTPDLSLPELIKSLPSPKIIWLMVPSGQPVDDLLFEVERITQYLQPGDIVIDGGNSFYEDSVRRGKKLAEQGIQFLDVGTSGGPGGAKNGACLMIGGDEGAYRQLQPLWHDIALPGGVQFFPGVGAGHFVKMIHNGIEYGMMQAIAEGFAILKDSPYNLDLTRIADVYNHGSVIESRLIQWLEQAFELHGTDLKNSSGTVGHSGEGQWTVDVAQKRNIQAAVIKAALQFRIESTNNPSYTGQVLTALRNQFGGHSLK